MVAVSHKGGAADLYASGDFTFTVKVYLRPYLGHGLDRAAKRNQCLNTPKARGKQNLASLSIGCWQAREHQEGALVTRRRQHSCDLRSQGIKGCVRRDLQVPNRPAEKRLLERRGFHRDCCLGFSCAHGRFRNATIEYLPLRSRNRSIFSVSKLACQASMANEAML